MADDNRPDNPPDNPSDYIPPQAQRLKDQVRLMQEAKKNKWWDQRSGLPPDEASTPKAVPSERRE